MDIKKTVMALVDLVLAEDSDSFKEAQKTLLSLKADPIEYPQDPEIELRKLLLQIGTPEHLVGFEYLVKAVLLVREDRKWIDNVTFGLYPQLAVIFDTTPSRVERAIRHAIEVTWERGDWVYLNRYFANIVSPDKGKPTNSEFLGRMANILRLHMNAA